MQPVASKNRPKRCARQATDALLRKAGRFRNETAVDEAGLNFAIFVPFVTG